MIGFHRYKPAELIGGDSYDPAPYDVWSTGVMLFFVVAGDAIFELLGGKNCFRLFEFMVNPEPEPRYAKYSMMLSDKKEIDPMTGAPPHTNFWEMFPTLKLSGTCPLVTMPHAQAQWYHPISNYKSKYNVSNVWG